MTPWTAGAGAELIRTLTDNKIRRTYSAGTTSVVEKYAKMLGALSTFTINACRASTLQQK
jgi:hypothetical protein